MARFALKETVLDGETFSAPTGLYISYLIPVSVAGSKVQCKGLGVGATIDKALDGVYNPSNDANSADLGPGPSLGQYTAIHVAEGAAAVEIFLESI